MTSFNFDYTPEQLQTLLNSGALSPETKRMLEQRAQTVPEAIPGEVPIAQAMQQKQQDQALAGAPEWMQKWGPAPAPAPAAEQQKKPAEESTNPADYTGGQQAQQQPQQGGAASYSWQHGGGGDFSGLQREARKATGAATSGMAAAEKDMGDAFAAQRRAINDQAELGAMRAADEVGYMRQRDAELEKVAAEKQQINTERAAWIDTERKKLDQFAAAASRDPWQDKTAGQMVGASIAIALSGIGNAIAGNQGPNGALQVLERAIDRETDARVRAYGAQRAKIAEGKEDFANLLQDQDAIRASVIEKFQRDIEGLTAEYASPQAQAQAQSLIAELDAKKAEHMQKSVADRFSMNMQGIGVQANLKQAEAAANAAKMQAMAQLSSQSAGLSIPGLEGRAVSKEAHNKAIEWRANEQTAQGQIADLLDHMKKYGAETANRAAVAAGLAKATAMHMTLKEVLRLGVLAGEDMKLLESMLPKDPGQWMQSTYLAKLDALRGYIKIRSKAIYGATGFSDPALKQYQQREEGVR